MRQQTCSLSFPHCPKNLNRPCHDFSSDLQSCPDHRDHPDHLDHPDHHDLHHNGDPIKVDQVEGCSRFHPVLRHLQHQSTLPPATYLFICSSIIVFVYEFVSEIPGIPYLFYM